MKRNKLIHWISTGLLSAMMLMSAGMYFFNYEEVAQIFTSLSFPTYIIYPLAIAKIVGIIVIWTRRSAALKEWAYAGFFFDFILAASAHFMINDGQHWGAIIAMVVMFVSYFTYDSV